MSSPQVIIAKLPTTSIIDASSYVIIERPGIGEGTFKSTVGDLQKAITVQAKVEQFDNVTRITIKDINGETQEEIAAPLAMVLDNGDGTISLNVTDCMGTTRETWIKDVRVVDPVPTEDSNNFVTSGTIYEMKQDIEHIIAEMSESINARLDDIVSRLELLESVVKLKYNTNQFTESGETVQTEQGQDVVATVVGTIDEMNNNEGYPDSPFTIDGKSYQTLGEAISHVSAHGGSIKLVGDATNQGLAVAENSEFTLDLNRHTLTVIGPGEGSPGTKTNGMQLLKNSTITIQNGSIVFNDSQLLMGIQNYSNLTLDNVTVIGGPTIQYVVSNNYGHVTFKNHTRLVTSAGQVAFDCWYGMSPVYDPGVNIFIEDDTVSIEGKVEFGKAARASGSDFHDHASITCPQNMSLNVTLLNQPCQWYNNGDGTKTLKYIGD